MSTEEFDKIISVKPPNVNKKIKPNNHILKIFNLIFIPFIEVNHLKILIPVGTPIIIVAAVK